MKRFLNKVSIGLAICVQAFFDALQANLKMEFGESTVKITYYFQAQATRYNKNGISRITIPTSITVDGNRYDKHHAQRLALEVFNDLSDAWILQATPIHYSLYQTCRDQFNSEVETMFGIGSATGSNSSSATETNS